MNNILSFFETTCAYPIRCLQIPSDNPRGESRHHHVKLYVEAGCRDLHSPFQMQHLPKRYDSHLAGQDYNASCQASCDSFSLTQYIWTTLQEPPSKSSLEIPELHKISMLKLYVSTKLACLRYDHVHTREKLAAGEESPAKTTANYDTFVGDRTRHCLCIS